MAETATRPAPVGLCPKCGEPVYFVPAIGKAGAYACDGGRECGFLIWPEVAHRKLPPKAVEELVVDGQTSKLLHGFRSHDGKEFAARLRLDPEQDNKVVFVFEDPAPIGKCPECGADVVDKPKSYGCAHWKPENGGCGFAIWKDTAGHRVTEDEAKALLDGQEVGPVECRSKAGKSFRATLYIDPQDGHRVAMRFEDHGAPAPDDEDDDYPEGE
ncbi:MAG: topoisomerase C-terminal repeat-containing protein [Thermaerobacter sp.]|nr:topoisomerase C-terminal repeat-containing protein [Thermaerobacter sp.]